jgi:hypothetical protein
VHKEIFEFERITKGSYKGKERDSIIKKVVDERGRIRQELCMIVTHFNFPFIAFSDLGIPMALRSPCL